MPHQLIFRLIEAMDISREVMDRCAQVVTMMHRNTRSIGARKVQIIVSCIVFCLLSNIYNTFRLLMVSSDDKIDDFPMLNSLQRQLNQTDRKIYGNSLPHQAQLMNPSARGEIPQLTAWLDTEASTQPHRLTSSAELSNYMCNPNPTSIETTIAANNMDKLLISISPPSLVSKIWPATKDFIPIYITFRAYSNETRPQTSGGDVFVVQYQSWSASIYVDSNNGDDDKSGNTTSFKAATFTSDNLDGTYTATLFIPRLSLHYINATLRHYYTCHTGLKLPAELKNSMIHELNFGPMIWVQLQDAIFKVSKSLDATQEVELLQYINRPCSSFDEILAFGVWKEKVDYPSDLSTKGAEWNPIFCILDKKRLPRPRGKAYRIGDSTMPHTLAEVGYPFDPFNRRVDAWDGKLKGSNGHDKSYSEAIWGTLRNASEHDIILYGGGLHHLFHANFNPKSIAKLVMKSTCQIGLVFPSNEQMLLRGPNPIQQHLHTKVDQTALNVRMINWELRAMLNRHDYKLKNLCEHLITVDDISISSLAHVASEDGRGNIMPDYDTTTLLNNRYNFTEYYAPTQVSLSKYLQGLSVNDRQRLYRNRTLRWIDTESFFLPRSEEYKPNDKIHDSVEFMFSQHHDLYRYLVGISIS